MSGNCIEGGKMSGDCMYVGSGDVWRLYGGRGRCLETVWREGEMSGDCIEGGDVWRPYVGRWRCLETLWREGKMSGDCMYICRDRGSLGTVWREGEMSGDCMEEGGRCLETVKNNQNTTSPDAHKGPLCSQSLEV